MKKIALAALIISSSMFVGCAVTPQSPVALSENFYSNKETLVGVYMDELPETKTHIVGAGCLLCIATAAAANSKLTTHLNTLGTDELADLDENLVEVISEKGVKASLIMTPINFDKLGKFKSDEPNVAKKDFTPLKEELGVDKLIVIDLNAAGAYRPYSSYVPTGDPVGTVMGLAYTIDLNTNQYELYENIDIKVSAEGEWKEPPTFPGVTNAYYEAVELTKDKVITLFK